MFDDYKKCVILAYRKKKVEGPISINLSLPTPAKLRKECLIVYSERRLQKDEEILRSFFGSKDNLKDYSQTIDRFQIEGFKALINFLKGRTSDPDERIVELLAWLIDFEPRPHDSRIDYKEFLEKESTPGGFDSSSIKEDEEDKVPQITPNSVEEEINSNKVEDEKSDAEIAESEIQEEEGPISVEGNKDAEEIELITYEPEPIIGRATGWKELLLRLKIRKAVVSFITIIVAGSIAYFVIERNQCMYWTGEHYQCIACNKKIGDTSIIALDTTKVAHLRKITRPDTLTENSLGKIWYSKIDSKLEFFTSDGFHPLYIDRRLRPVTPYILKKYVFK